MDLGQFGQIGALATSVAFLVQGLVSGITLSWPERPSWAPWLASILLGIFFTWLMAHATGGFRVPDPLEQVYAQIVIVGIVAGLAAGGVNQATVTAERKRQVAKDDAPPPIETRQ